MVFSLATCFGLEIDHNQVIYSHEHASKNAVCTASYCLFVGSDNHSIKEFKNKGLTCNANIYINQKKTCGPP